MTVISSMTKNKEKVEEALFLIHAALVSLSFKQNNLLKFKIKNLNLITTTIRATGSSLEQLMNKRASKLIIMSISIKQRQIFQ